jgi:N-hydroxyarylamine O-acetyltransferase
MVPPDHSERPSERAAHPRDERGSDPAATVDALDADRYLSRIGLDPDVIRKRPRDRETLARLQRAHVTAVPFENLSITGTPTGRWGDGVTLSVPALYAKVVDEERGGYCFELNGLFGWLLAELGFDVTRLAGRVVGDDGEARPPANHHPLLVALDEPFLVDAGLGTPAMRRPAPLSGDSRTDGVGVTWRVVDSERPDAEYATEFRWPDDEAWTLRYVFTTTPRELAYFRATCDYLQTAPESPFTGDPYVRIATDAGYKTLDADTLTRVVDGDKRETPVADDKWDAVLEREFGIA